MRFGSPLRFKFVGAAIDTAAAEIESVAPALYRSREELPVHKHVRTFRVPGPEATGAGYFGCTVAVYQ